MQKIQAVQLAASVLTTLRNSLERTQHSLHPKTMAERKILSFHNRPHRFNLLCPRPTNHWCSTECADRLVSLRIMTSSDTAPVAIISRNDDSRIGTPLLVFLHGYGSNEQDLMGLSRYLPEEFTYLSVRAPLPAGSGYSWFPLSQEIDYSTEAVGQSVQALWSLLEPLSVQHSSVTLLGFSQGMAMATSLARFQPDAIGAVVGLSGFAVEPQGLEIFDDATVQENPIPMFWGRDLADPVITRDKVEYTLGWVSKHTELTSETYPQIGHSVSKEELEDVDAFLKKVVLGQ